MVEKPRDIKVILAEAMEKPTAEERSAYLQDVCRDDLCLREEVESLLMMENKVGDLMDVPILDSNAVLDTPSVNECLGSMIDRYKLLEKIGEGGMAVVYMAQQERPVQRKVALKIIKPGMDTKQVIARFEAERQVLAMMDHPNIAKVFDGGATEAGRLYFVMELVRGVTITEYCDENRLGTVARLHLFAQVCHAVQHAHQKGIIHRDIKPSNVMVTLHDDKPVPKIIDFGIAKATNQLLTEKTIFTRYAQMIGTPTYMSPEQTQMSGLDIDTRSDIYSLGVLLYELLAGRTPFDEKILMQAGFDAMRKIIREQEPLRPSTKLATLQIEEQSTTARCHATHPPKLISLLRGDLDWIVMKCLEKDRTRRYDTANSLALDVARHLSNEPVTARPPTVAYQLQKAWLRNKVVYTAGCMVVASLIIGISLSVWQACVAVRASKSEHALRMKAQERELEQRLVAYESDMKAGQTYLRENDLDKVAELLDRYVPEPGDDDLRGIEWQYLRQVSTGDELHTFPHETMVRSISLSADGARLASITMSGKVRLFEVDSRRKLQERGGGDMSYGAQDGSVALSPDGRFLAADQQGILKVWDANSGALVHSRIQVTAPISFSPDSRSLAGVTETGLQFWNTTDWKSRPLGKSLNIDTSKIRSLAFTPDGSRLIFAPTRFTSKLVIYNLADSTLEGELTGLDRPGVISANGAVVAAGGSDGDVCVWDLANQKLIRKFKAHKNIVLGVALSPNGRMLVTGGDDYQVLLWNTETFDQIDRIKGHHNQVWNLQFSRDGRYLVSASADASVKLWEWERIEKLIQKVSTTDKPDTPKSSVQRSQVTGDDETTSQRAPRTHTVKLGDSVQAAIDAAMAGDQIDLAAGTYAITDMIVVTKPLIIRGVPSKEGNGALSTILVDSSGLPFVIQVATEAASACVLMDLQIEANASAIQHVSGGFELRHCCVIVRSALNFKSAIRLEAMGNAELPRDRVTVDGCYLLAEYVGDTPAGMPPDVDILVAKSGSHYREITVADCEMINEVPNAISNSIETQSTTSHVTIRGNYIRSQGLGIILPNHVGAIDIRSNTIWSTCLGISLSIESQSRNTIIDNHITIDDQGLQIYPVFLKDIIARGPSVCITIGQVSAGVTAGVFHKEVIGCGTNFLVEKNVLTGNPKYGIALVDSPEPEKFGPPTPNSSHDNIITRNDFTHLKAEQDIALGASTFNNQIFDNIGTKSIFREAGDDDRNSVKNN
ncbi:protein kinase [Planctomycetota bacterium]